ncbi:MAG: HAD-IIIA family hydrolase [Nitrospirae bacterium]|nr:HAD-IIIA family hydrolase [Nitrospirota bacterium]MBF0534680.1 HAD-IIIA family hydrolase [Nitrospirota bacterium]MBF0616276.1 HAD-IIIA family hydrolase [Nitrospirota bacterium]
MSDKQQRILDKAKPVKLLILDVDGVLTDGKIVFGSGSSEMKSFNVRDGHGIVVFKEQGFHVAIITGRDSEAVTRRATELGITDVYQKCWDKVKAYEELKARYNLSNTECAYVGDDIVDIPLLLRVGFGITVGDGHPDAKAVSAYVTENYGGNGAVREVCELILKTKNLWDKIIGDLKKVS